METPLTDFETINGALYVKVKGEFKRAAKCSTAETKGNRNKDSFDCYGYRKYLKADKLFRFCKMDNRWLLLSINGRSFRTLYITKISS